MKKKLFVIALSTMLLAASLTGCGNTNDGNQSTTSHGSSMFAKDDTNAEDSTASGNKDYTFVFTGDNEYVYHLDTESSNWKAQEYQHPNGYDLDAGVVKWSGITFWNGEATLDKPATESFANRYESGEVIPMMTGDEIDGINIFYLWACDFTGSTDTPIPEGNGYDGCKTVGEWLEFHVEQNSCGAPNPNIISCNFLSGQAEDYSKGPDYLNTGYGYAIDYLYKNSNYAELKILLKSGDSTDETFEVYIGNDEGEITNITETTVNNYKVRIAEFQSEYEYHQNFATVQVSDTEYFCIDCGYDVNADNVPNLITKYVLEPMNL